MSQVEDSAPYWATSCQREDKQPLAHYSITVRCNRLFTGASCGSIHSYIYAIYT